MILKISTMAEGWRGEWVGPGIKKREVWALPKTSLKPPPPPSRAYPQLFFLGNPCARLLGSSVFSAPREGETGGLEGLGQHNPRQSQSLAGKWKWVWRRRGAWLDSFSDPSGPIPTRAAKLTPLPGPGAPGSASLLCSARRMEGSGEGSGGDQTRTQFPMEPLESQVPKLEPKQVLAEERQPESPGSSPSLASAVKEAAGASQDLSSGKKLPSPRPAPLKLLPLSLGYGAFRRQASSGSEPPSPGPAATEQSRDGETPGAELAPRATPGEPAPGSWAPMELQVDVRVKPVGTAGGSRAPSPAPSTRFLTVPVPESPAFSRHASPAQLLLRQTPSPGSTWGRGVPLAVGRAERGLDGEGWASHPEGRAESPGSPTCRCRCKEDAVLLPRAEVDGDKKLSRVIKLIGKRAPVPGAELPGGWGSTNLSAPPSPHPPSAGLLGRRD